MTRDTEISAGINQEPHSAAGTALLRSALSQIPGKRKKATRIYSPGKGDAGINCPRRGHTSVTCAQGWSSSERRWQGVARSPAELAVHAAERLEGAGLRRFIRPGLLLPPGRGAK